RLLSSRDASRAGGRRQLPPRPGGAGGGERAGRESAGGDAERGGADGHGGGDVERRIADHDDATALERLLHPLRAARGADAQQLAAILVVAAEAPEPPGRHQAVALDLAPGPLAQVA